MHNVSITRLIKEKAIDLGFTFAGVTTPESPRHYAAYLAWLEDGFHGEMAYMEKGRAARADLRQVFPECRSVICLCWPYPAMQVDADAPVRLNGLVAAYAWGVDYHVQLVEKMSELVAFIERITARGFSGRMYTDSGAILEREYAQKAGLGWAGKHTALITPRRGSYFLLAEILTDLDLEPDDPFTADRCGDCRRCLDACPTKCILPGRVLDARRCIAYLTIEHRAALPLELRPAIGNWIFGCDICQQVCPWNVRFAQPKMNYPAVDLTVEATLTPDQFRRKYRQSAVERARRRGYVRNAAVALGNSRNPEAAAVLETLLNGDTEPLVRGHAAWALGRLPGQKARRVLTLALQRENDAYVIGEIQRALEDPC